MLPPGLVVAERLRIVVLARSGDGPEREMLVHQVDAQRVLPVAEPLHVLEPQVPAGAAVSFAEGSPLADLVRHAGEFLHAADVAELRVHSLVELVEQHVDGRNLMPGVHRHVVGTLRGVGPGVLPVMPGPRDVFALGVVVPGLRPAVDEQVQEHGVVVVANPPPIADLLKERGEARLQIVAPTLLKLREEVRACISWPRGREARYSARL